MKQSIFLPVSSALTIFKSPVKSAKTANLVYVNDAQEGIKRIRRGKGYVYFYQGKQLRNKEELERIRKLVIPPAWESVWICSQHNGHIQATGLDTKKRKQYRYHTDWSMLRNQTKFSRLTAFGEILPQIRAKVATDLAQKTLTLDKILALIISLMEQTYIRIGNNGYEKLYGSYGLTTLKDQHVKIDKDAIRFAFKGKKGIHHTITLKNRKLARIVKQCREIPGKELFQYYDENNMPHPVHSEHVNQYIKSICGEDFTAKDFRTWAGSVHAIRSFMDLGEAESITMCRQNIIKTLDYVSAKLGNTRTVCKKYYVHPVIIELYESRGLYKYLETMEADSSNDENWSAEERILINILTGKKKRNVIAKS